MKLRSGTSLWKARREQVPHYEPLAGGDVCCEIAVLGGGITGALVSHYLVRDGRDVVLLDRGEFAEGSTAASTGLLQYEVDTPMIDLMAQVGERHAVHAYQRGRTAIDDLDQLTSELGGCGFERQDSLYFASNVWHYRSLKREFEFRQKFGFDEQFLSRGELAERTSIRAPGAILSHGDAYVDPYAFTLRLIAASVQQGLKAHARTKIDDVDEQADGVVLRSEHGTIRAKEIVYATGYESERYLSSPKGSLDSTYAVASQPALEVPGWPDDWLIWESARPYFYARRTVDGRAIIGGEDTAFANDHDRDELVDRKVERLLARFAKLFPEARFEAEYAWAGTFAGTKDGLPFIGRPEDRPRAMFALGYGGNGITFSVIAAQVIRDLLAGRPNKDAEVFRFGR